MTLKSALQEVKETTLAAIKGLLGKLAYLASLRHGRGRYEHWGMESVYGAETSERAFKAAHAEIVAGVLRTPLATLENDLEVSSRASGVSASNYITQMRRGFVSLLPGERKDVPTVRHLNSVLVALSYLEKNRARAIQSISSLHPPPGPKPQHPADA